jgi:hypothetical protein
LNLTKQELNLSIFDSTFTSDEKSLFVFYDYDDHYNLYSSGFYFYDQYPAIKYKGGLSYHNKLNCYHLLIDCIKSSSSSTIFIYKYSILKHV